MKFSAEIIVMPHKELLDPQGKAVLNGLTNLGLKNVEDIRIGKHILMKLDASSRNEAMSIAKTASQKLLANQVMEEFNITIEEDQ